MSKNRNNSETTSHSFLADVKLCTNCGVPEHLHNTCCGWDNASVIIKEGETLTEAITGEEKKQRWLESIQRKREIPYKTVSRIKPRTKALTIDHAYLGFKFLNYSDHEEKWNEVIIIKVDPDSIDIKNIDEFSKEYHNIWTITDGEFLNINNSKKI